MKSINLTYSQKELQANLFYAFTFGLMQANLGEGFHIVYDNTETDFVWKVMKHHTAEGCAVSGEPEFYHYVNKGMFQMNDVRLGVITSYLRDESEKFIQGFFDYIKQHPTLGIVKDDCLIDRGHLASFGRYLLSKERAKEIATAHDPLEVYHSDIENWIASGNSPDGHPNAVGN
jgi:hypothetical protein